MAHYKILELVHNKKKLIMKGMEEPQTFWIELIDLNNGDLQETSEKVSEWDDAVLLLEKYKWDKYETNFVDSMFTKKIGEARKRSKLTPQYRILELYESFLQDDELNSEKIASYYGVSTDTVGRDLNVLRKIFGERNQTISYDAKDHVFRLNSLEGKLLNKPEIIAVLLIVFSSRAFNKEELEQIADKLTQYVSEENQRQIRQFMHSFYVHYQPIQIENTIEMIRDILQAIQNKRVLSFYYHRDQSKFREVIPISMTFHNGLFYLLAFKKGEMNKLISWRFDRMTDLKVENDHFKLEGPYLEVGDYLKRSVKMFSGSPEKVQLSIKEGLLEYLRREFPLVTYKPGVNGWMNVDVEVNGFEAITFWVLQQAENVEVLGPLNFRQQVQEKIKKMHEIYN